MHHPQHISDAKTSGVENVGLRDQCLRLLENEKVVDQRLNNSMENGKNPDILPGTHGQIEGDREEIETLWQRMRWTDEMVQLLISAAAYVGQHAKLSQQNRNQKKGKWKAISQVIVERGYLVSPQQCEDKFNDLNKKYKRLNEILGNGTAFNVVENPSVMDSLNLSDETAEEIIKILGSKQLFYQELCSYHNGNRLFLPHDQDLERSILLALKGKDKKESDQDPIRDEKSVKRMKEGEDPGLVVPENCLNCKEQKDARCLSPVGGEGEELPNERWTIFLLQKLEEQRLELEKKRLRWLRYSQHEDRKLEKMNLENRSMKLQNQRFAFELESRKKARKQATACGKSIL